MFSSNSRISVLMAGYFIPHCRYVFEKKKNRGNERALWFRGYLVVDRNCPIFYGRTKPHSHGLSEDVGGSQTCPVQNGCQSYLKRSKDGIFWKYASEKLDLSGNLCVVLAVSSLPFFIIILFLLSCNITKHEKKLFTKKLCSEMDYLNNF